MLIGEKIKEISTTISYHENKHSEKFTTSGSGNIVYRNGKIHSTKLKMVFNQITFFFHFTPIDVNIPLEKTKSL